MSSILGKLEMYLHLALSGGVASLEAMLFSISDLFVENTNSKDGICK